jgi:hypothetical protein
MGEFQGSRVHLGGFEIVNTKGYSQRNERLLRRKMEKRERVREITEIIRLGRMPRS